MDENQKQLAEASRKRRLRWSIAICFAGLFLVAVNFGVATWADFRRRSGKPFSPMAGQVVIGAGAIMPPGIILFVVGFAGATANASRENSAPHD